MKLTYVQNTGGAFGIGSSSTVYLIIINIIVLIMVGRFLISQYKKMGIVSKNALCLILAGGISNLYDRIIKGFVIDYINISDFFKFAVFNLADIFVVVGWTILVIYTIIYAIKNK